MKLLSQDIEASTEERRGEGRAREAMEREGAADNKEEEIGKREKRGER
jgi:hypothetical protein